LERKSGEWDHGRLQLVLGAWFLQHEREWNIRVVIECRMKTSATRYRVPDLTVVSGDAPAERVRSVPPLLAIEILSPEDRVLAYQQRFRDFQTMGVRNAWVLDPLERRAWVVNLANGSMIPATELKIPGTDIHVPLPDIFEADFIEMTKSQPFERLRSGGKPEANSNAPSASPRHAQAHRR
jgi:Uma2 family endonuclease